MGMAVDLVERLKADPGIAAIVGDAVNWFDPDRVHAYPAVVLQKISAGREYTHNGPDGLDGPRVQFDCIGRTDAEAEDIKLAVIACMEMPGTTGDTKFHNGFLEGESWLALGEQDGGQSLFQISIDFIFFHEEA